jgi:6-phosphogluconolactonase/glucosamine-6-phosphate isomerase/deaminase
MKSRQLQVFSGPTMAQAAAAALPTLLEHLKLMPALLRVGTCAGSTVQPFYRALADARRVFPDWNTVLGRILFVTGDERVVAQDDPACNLTALRRDLFGPLGVSDSHIEWFRYTGSSPDFGLRNFNTAFSRRGGGVDVNICSLGPKEAGFGHFYSVFGPILAQIWDAHEYVMVEQGEKEPRRRITLPPKLVLAAPLNLVFIARGREDVARAFMTDSPGFEDCPGRLLRYYEPLAAAIAVNPTAMLITDCGPASIAI